VIATSSDAGARRSRVTRVPAERTRNRVRGGNARRAGAERQDAFATPWRVARARLRPLAERIASVIGARAPFS
jgi:hypothetical protein